MTDATTIWADTLPVTDQLVLEVLLARHRLGEHCWTFPNRLRPALRRLEALRLITWKNGVVERTCIAHLTDRGRALLDASYQPPLVKALMQAAAAAPVVAHPNGYPVQAVPNTDLFSILNTTREKRWERTTP